MTDHAPIAVSPIPAVNVACVPQRSPLRYPGGKTWLIPHVRAWLGGSAGTTLGGPPGATGRAPLLEQLGPPAGSPLGHTCRPRMLIEPFAGGGIVSLTAVMEGLVERCLLAELDRDVAAFWHAALRFGPALTERVLRFEPTRQAIVALMSQHPADVVEQGFRTLVLNRTRRGGILAPGASLSRQGENGKGLASRWYPHTIASRLTCIGKHSSRLTFCETDGLALLHSILQGHGGGSGELVAFIDPPYTAGGKRAGRRLYAHHQIDHERLFAMLADSRIDFLMTYDCAPEILALVAKHEFHAVQVAMKNTHHAKLRELVITRRNVFEPPLPPRSAGWNAEGTGTCQRPLGGMPRAKQADSAKRTDSKGRDGQLGMRTRHRASHG